MRRILIAYGTTDGHTARIAAFLGEALRSGGASVDIARAGVAGADPDPAGFDAVIVAASVHAGGYQRALRGWVTRHAGELGRKPTAMISVCLGVLEKHPKAWAELDRIVDRFMEKTGWRPSVVKIAAGAVPFTRYGWLKRAVMRRIMRRSGADLDPARDHVYTDWEDLRLFAMGFLRRSRGGDEGLLAAAGGDDRVEEGRRVETHRIGAR